MITVGSTGCLWGDIMTISANRFLTLAEMKVNAQYIMNYLLPLGWTKNAISGMLGNMQTESTINPGIWESLDEGNMSRGFGLVQWTPASKYTNWADLNGLAWGDMDSNLLRILYEVEENIQWIHPSMTFYQFTQSTDTPYNLGLMFLQYYERPADPDQPNRGTQAEYWFNTLDGGGVVDPPDEPDVIGGQLPPPSGTNTSKQLITMLLTDAVNGWKW